VGISYKRVHILHNELSQVLKKLSASWIPHLLNPKQKRIWIQTSDCLKMFKKNPKDFMRRFKTMDEIWIHHSTFLFERANRGHICLFWGPRKNLETTSGRESRNWRNIGSVLSFEKILKNKITWIRYILFLLSFRNFSIYFRIFQ